jgi:hypothetical protein
MKKATILFIAIFIPVFLYSQDIDYAEYFVDADPGYGVATPIALSGAGTDLSMDFNADVSSLSQGFHFVSVRVRDDQGRWSHGMNQFFYLVKILEERVRNLGWLEYFIDNDPGFGNATSTPIRTPSNEIILDLNPDLQGLEQGIHYIHFRSRDFIGRWGTVMNSAFFIVELPSSVESNIQQLEYFVNDDPGYGLANQVTLPSAGSDLTIDFTVPKSGLGDGNHVLYIRAKNDLNKWGLVFAEGFALIGTGLAEEEITSLFKIYPNPSSGIVQIELTDESLNESRIRLMDLNGKLLYETECHSRQCELNLELPGGIYLLNIESTERSITQKLILE